jgi:hypothetical protein
MKVNIVIEIDPDDLTVSRIEHILDKLYLLTDLLEGIIERETQSKENIQEH